MRELSSQVTPPKAETKFSSALSTDQFRPTDSNSECKWPARWKSAAQESTTSCSVPTPSSSPRTEEESQKPTSSRAKCTTCRGSSTLRLTGSTVWPTSDSVLPVFRPSAPTSLRISTSDSTVSDHSTSCTCRTSSSVSIPRPAALLVLTLPSSPNPVAFPNVLPTPT